MVYDVFGGLPQYKWWYFTSSRGPVSYGQSLIDQSVGGVAEENQVVRPLLEVTYCEEWQVT